MALTRLYEDYQVGSVDCLSYHDDIAFGSDCEDTMENFKDIDNEVCQQLGIPVNHRKGFYGQNFVLCENYSDEIFGEKESYQRMALKQIHASENVTHAKFQWLSVFRYVNPELWGKYIEELVLHFGNEFYDRESSAPSLLGGWVPYSYQKIDVSLYLMDRLPSRNEYAASLVGLQTVHKYPERRKFPNLPYEPPIKKLYPFIENYGSTSVFLTDMTLNEVGNSMTRLQKIGLTSWFWNYQRKARLKKYNDYVNAQWMNYEDWFGELRRVHPTTDIMPPKNLITRVPVERYPEISRLYKPSNPKMSYLAALNPGKLSDKIVPWPVPPEVSTTSTLSMTAFERSKIRFESHFFSRYTADLREMEIAIPTLRAINSDEWFSPMSAISFILAMEHEEALPTWKPRESVAKIDDQLFYKVNNPDHEQLYVYLTSRLGTTKVDKINMTYFEREVGLFLYATRAKKLKEIKRLVEEAERPPSSMADSWDAECSSVSGFSWDSGNLNDCDFFTWRTSKQNYTNWRNHYFATMEAKIVALEILESGYLNSFESEEKRKEYAFIDPVEVHLFKESGGIFDENMVPILNRVNQDSDEESVRGDFFADGSGSDGSSEGGLMVGF